MNKKWLDGSYKAFGSCKDYDEWKRLKKLSMVVIMCENHLLHIYILFGYVFCLFACRKMQML
jgi:hypothetical protein